MTRKRYIISIHAPRTGRDGRQLCGRVRRGYFNPRSPHGERRGSGSCFSRHFLISIHAPRTGSDIVPEQAQAQERISIHAPRTGSDFGGAGYFCRPPISIHAPRTGSDMDAAFRLATVKTFQSTLPARGATFGSARPPNSAAHFNPRSPHGERHAASATTSQAIAFQSTLTARGATSLRCWSVCFRVTYFNPRSPHGERHCQQGFANHCNHFNPRSPHGERPIVSRVLQIIVTISIHAPRTGSDGRVGVDGRQPDISIHAPRTGSDAQNQSCL